MKIRAIYNLDIMISGGQNDKKLALLVSVVLLISYAASFPKKEKIVKLPKEEATNVLKGRTRKEIIDNWGEPDEMLSGFYGDIYVCKDRHIVIYYNDESQVTDVLTADNSQ